MIRRICLIAAVILTALAPATFVAAEVCVEFDGHDSFGHDCISGSDAFAVQTLGPPSMNDGRYPLRRPEGTDAQGSLIEEWADTPLPKGRPTSWFSPPSSGGGWGLFSGLRTTGGHGRRRRSPHGVIDTFSDLPNTDPIGSDGTAHGDGFVYPVVPAPGAAALGAIGLTMIASRRRQRAHGR